jgi:Uma2 family endonuclease
MSVASPITPAFVPATVPVDDLFKFTVNQYHEMVQRGILTADDPVELLEGYLVRKMPKNPPHCYATDALFEVLLRLMLVGYFPRGQNPVTTNDSEPEPDVSVVRGKREDFLGGHPGPKHCALVVEVSDSTLTRDRGIKKRIYARAGVPVYWIVNLQDQRFEVYASPNPAAAEFASPVFYGMQDRVPIVLDGKEVGQIAVSQVIPQLPH